MKKKIAAFIKQKGGTCSYSGITKTMYVHGKNSEKIEEAIIYEYGFGLPFKVDGTKKEMPIF